MGFGGGFILPTVNSLLTADIGVVVQPSKNYCMNLREEFVRGFTDELAAMEQVVFKILSTERYESIIYSWNYGVELNDLLGENVDFVCSEVKRRISEALLADNRVEAVENFKFDTGVRHVVAVSFDVVTVFGVLEIGKEVSY